MSRSGDRTSTFDPSHSDNLLHGLNLLWRKQLFCDVTLTAQGQQFHCHKAVLASCSQYFRSLFSSHPPLGGGVGGQDGLGAPKDPPQPPQPQPPSQQPQPPPQEEPGTPSSSPDDKLLTSPRAINNLVLQGCSSIGLRLVLEYLYTANVTLSGKIDTASCYHIRHSSTSTAPSVEQSPTQEFLQKVLNQQTTLLHKGTFHQASLNQNELNMESQIQNHTDCTSIRSSVPARVHLTAFTAYETLRACSQELPGRLGITVTVNSSELPALDGIRSNKKMLLLVGGLPPGPDRLPSNLVQYYDDEKKTWKILT
ncbi:kelch-like protein 14, partial [Carlito syrichta]|uniref:Kelch-like protein 14 n=1 Tax=Carlito syrichta TaxID=1868482 RepID=A0A3Q0DNT1_CARSF